MPCQCLFDRFPVELLHIIFSYLSADDILHSFLDLSRYLNTVLANYDRYVVNLESILKPNFDLICERISRPGIVALTLCDGPETPNQSKEFLLRLPIEEFAEHLRSLTLSDIESESMQWIEDRSILFSNLTALSLNRTLLVRPEKFSSLLSRLTRLKLTDGNVLATDISLEFLEHLTITNRCNAQLLQRIFNVSRKLKSFQARLSDEGPLILDQPVVTLTRLVLDMSREAIHHCEVTMLGLEQFLSFLPNLIDFEIEARADADLCNGQRWEFFIQNSLLHLIKFNFKLQIKSTVMFHVGGVSQVLLRSFSTPFWLEEKQWFIAIEWQLRLLYSVPRFAIESADSNFRPPLHSTSPNKNLFYDHINALAVWGELSHRFNYVEELWLVSNPSMSILSKVIDLNRIKRLICSSSDSELSFETFIHLLEQAPLLKHIRFFNIPSWFGENDSHQFIQIHQLELLRETNHIEWLKRVFPSIQRFTMRIESLTTGTNLLRVFATSSLSSVTFLHGNPRLPQQAEPWIKEYFERAIGHSNFTWSVDETNTRLWIGQPKKQTTISKGCLPWRKFGKLLCHRSKTNH